ncbi:PREDICTED: nuclear pore complex protein Nup133 [Papilio xuthus]|uniref:Nuclear pore complex protein Nup133 n=1 Tax=Papilio xuthus TaxID=66420 RepID=A0AAJ7EBD6_PAPXU|nr:PREDICTED: nuclear pore complex protein Nup133 [Papilio xuthus]
MDFNSTGGIRSPFSPRVKQSITGRRPIGLSSAKKSQSNYMQSPGAQKTGDVIYKTPLITLETYGLPLPVMVTEALTFASGEVSARMSTCGWCWVVAGRRVLAWPNRPELVAAARELTLPQTDLAHKADLVVLFYEDDAQLPSCIGVSPEGVIRYWPSVGQEGVYVDVSAELAGQECEQLGEPTKSGLVLATTTCTVVLLTPTMLEGRPTVTCRTLRPPSGWLGGIGRRVSLLFFGSMPANADTKLVGVVVLSGGVVEGGGEAGAEDGAQEEGAAEECVALVASGPQLQLWRGAELHEHHLHRALADATLRAHQGHLPHQVDLSGLEVTALDVHASGPHSLVLLVAAVSVARSPDKRYAIVELDVSQPQRVRVRSARALRPPREDARPPRCLPSPATPLLYSPTYVALLTGSGSSEKMECIEVSAEGDRVLGGALCAGVPLLFTRQHGVLALRSPRPHHLSVSDSPLASPAAADLYEGNLSMYEIDPNEMNALATDPRSKLKTAFLFHLRREPAAARILAEEFPARAGAGVGAGSGAGSVDAPLDAAVAGAARELLDDAPAGDPRWRRAAPRSAAALGASAALQLAAQLRDKARAFALFLDFLRAHSLWRRLADVTRECGDGAIGTQQLLGAYGERLAAARALRRLQEEGAHLVDAAVHQVGRLHMRDPSFADVAQGAEAEEWRGGAGWEEEEACEREEAAALRAGALSADDVAFRRVSRGVLSEVQAWRAQWLAAGGPAPPARPADPALRPALLQLHTPEAGQTQRAAALAEKFQDLELLVQLCVRDGDLPRLHTYMEKYADQGVAEIAFAWLASGGGERRALLVREVGAREPDRLARWLAARPERAQLRALHLLARRRPAPAAAALLALLAPAHRTHAPPPTLNRTTTIASLAKLCLLASEEEGAEEGALREAEAQLSLCEHHRALPAALRPLASAPAPAPAPAGDTDCPLLGARRLLQLYIESESETLTEYDYKKALDLTDFIEEPELREELSLQVWCACALRTRWEELASEAAAGALRDTALYRLADLVHLMGGEVRASLPPLGALLAALEGSPRLAARARDPRFHFALKLAYEYIQEDHPDPRHSPPTTPTTPTTPTIHSY